MKNLRKRLNNIITSALLIALVGCSFCKPRLLYPLCPSISLDRKVTETIFEDGMGKSPSIYVKITDPSPKVKKSLTCLLHQEYLNIKEKNRKDLVLVTFHIQDRGLVSTYILNFELDVLIELQFIPIDNSKYVLNVLSSFPLSNIMKSISNPDKPVLIFPLDEKVGLINKTEVLILLSKITNGLFFN